MEKSKKKKKKDLKSIALCTTVGDSKETIQIHETVTWVWKLTFMELLDTITDYLLLPDQHLPLLSRFKKEIYLDRRLKEDQRHCNTHFFC